MAPSFCNCSRMPGLVIAATIAALSLFVISAGRLAGPKTPKSRNDESRRAQVLSGPHALWPGRAETLIAAASRASVNALGHVATRDAQYHAAAVGKARSVRRRRMP